MEMKLCKTPFVQRLTRKKRHCTKSFNAVQQRKDSSSSPCFPRTLLLRRLLFYDLAKVLHTFSLQWLIYTHVVAMYTHKKKILHKSSEAIGNDIWREGLSVHNSKSRIFCNCIRVQIGVGSNQTASFCGGVKKVDALLFHLH